MTTDEAEKLRKLQKEVEALREAIRLYEILDELGIDHDPVGGVNSCDCCGFKTEDLKEYKIGKEDYEESMELCFLCRNTRARTKYEYLHTDREIFAHICRVANELYKALKE